jgi:hypothetical protein
MIICNNFSDLNSELILEIIPVITSLKIKKKKKIGCLQLILTYCTMNLDSYGVLLII